MRPASINRVIPSLLLFLLAVNALPSGERQDDAPPEGDLDVSKVKVTAGGFRKTLDKLFDDLGGTGDNGAPKSVQTREIKAPGPATFHAFEASKRSGFGLAKGYDPSDTYLKSRAPDIKLPEKRDLESKDIERRDPGTDRVERRGTGPSADEESYKNVKRSSESQEMKAKLRARAEVEREKEEYESAKRKWEERSAHNKKVRHHNMKRLFQHGSPFQEYHNTVPISAYAADDGSFGHALPGVRRSPIDNTGKVQKRSLDTSTLEGELKRRKLIKARLQELGYAPNDDENPKSTDQAEKLKKRGEGSDATFSKWNRSPLAKRDISHHIACPGTGLMSAYGNVLFNSNNYFTLTAIFRAACFGCDCRATATGFHMGPRQEDTYSTSDPVLINKPQWEAASKNTPATYSDVTYNPQTKTTYSDKYAAAAHINEVTFDGFSKVKRHLQTPNSSHVGELFAGNKRSATSEASEELVSRIS
ncbi:hypothetical protein TWF970_000998 [Orbilia oligospora]|uniref:Uncharacterized protein n=1 Tax=Orbilia oligospora TaxID=2813651 RepID=A0A7C8VEP4_ORBOL|nr:hypothetical protein TWF970_000998 [Orbilia oligospora]